MFYFVLLTYLPVSLFLLGFVGKVQATLANELFTLH